MVAPFVVVKFTLVLDVNVESDINLINLFVFVPFTSGKLTVAFSTQPVAVNVNFIKVELA